MATVEGMTPDAILALVNDCVESGSIEDGQLILTTKGGENRTVGPVASITDFLHAAYPVGSTFTSTIATDPATQLGFGTWISFGAGRVIVGVDPSQSEFANPEETGGEKTHQLTVSELPKHQVQLDHDHPSADTSSNGDHSHSINESSGTGAGTTVARGQTSIDNVGSQPINNAGAHTHSVDIPKFTGNSPVIGSDQAHNNLQPYITAYVWKRTA